MIGGRGGTMIRGGLAGVVVCFVSVGAASGQAVLPCGLENQRACCSQEVNPGEPPCATGLVESHSCWDHYDADGSPTNPAAPECACGNGGNNSSTGECIDDNEV